ncbi:MAG TPA: HAMP domain-containing sensor histidine kinase [Polyangiaceae bacterium]|jgi:signal transduction histidine kinase|nr:HAMP domain-containing sensor histidine kinase [Polyangiaceae bacterium]
MRLTRKFLLGLALIILAVFGISAERRLSREIAYFDWDMRRDAAFTGVVLARAVAKIWQDEGAPEAMKLVRHADLSSHHMHVRWVWLDDPVIAKRIAGPVQNAISRGEAASLRVEGPALRPGAVFTYVPVSTPAVRGGALELSESLEEELAYLDVTRRNVILETAALLVASGVVASALGFMFIGRPMRLLVDKARRVGKGDLSGPLVLPQRDELGALASEINTMCDRLAQARDRVIEETGARVSAVEQLRHADRLMTVGKLASGIAHELGTPLNVIAGRAQMIAEGEATGDAVADNARIIGEQAQRMTRIIRQLLDFARRGTRRKDAIDLRKVANQCVSMLEGMAGKANVLLHIDAPRTPIISYADGGQIEQALTNLIVNAIQATPKGGSVHVEVGQERATPPADHGGSANTFPFLRVVDTGSGMDEMTASRIFEPFFTTKSVGEGTGLGLSVSYGIARDHGGWIDVESHPCAGSRFTLRLDQAEGART